MKNYLFTCHSEKKAVKSARKVLNRFATKIGERTWQARLTQEGLKTLHGELKLNASRYLSVVCHELSGPIGRRCIWVVGNKNHINRDGELRLKTKSINRNYTEPKSSQPVKLLSAITKLAGYFHDLGKASAGFQQKLIDAVAGKQMELTGEPWRHELVSVLMLDHLFSGFELIKSDAHWISQLKNVDWPKTFKKYLHQQAKVSESGLDRAIPFPDREKTPLLYAITWMVLTHHRLPSGTKDQLDKQRPAYGEHAKAFEGDETKWKIAHNTKDAPWNSKHWQNAVRACVNDIELLSDNHHEFDDALLFGRLTLQISDHLISAANERCPQQDKTITHANTNTENGTVVYRQTLVDHLLRVGHRTTRTLQRLTNLESSLPAILADDLPERLKPTTGAPQAFRWQDDAARKVSDAVNGNDVGFFACVMAGTGAGKTIGCAKIMAAAGSRVRLTYTTPMRALTLQTGDSMREDLGLEDDELAVIIGNDAIAKLHELEKQREREGQSAAPGDEELSVFGGQDLNIGDLDKLLPKSELTATKKRMLATPVLVSTLDTIMKIADSRRGNHIVHALRVITSDVIIDEVDMFDASDCVAIGRLVYQVGLAGRKVILSSATLRKDVAIGLFKAWLAGYESHCRLFEKDCHYVTGWFADHDGEQIVIRDIDATQFAQQHATVARTIVSTLKSRNPKRKVRTFVGADILDEREQSMLAEAIIEEALQLACAQYIEQEQKRLSVGLIQLSHIDNCAWLALELIKRWPHEKQSLKVLVHHARFTLGRRSAAEALLNTALTRKRDEWAALKIDEINKTFKEMPQQQLTVIVISTLESTGRDHDYDWAIVEPSTSSVVVQTAGRIRRHRQANDKPCNLSILCAPVKHWSTNPAHYFRPGIEDVRVGSVAQLLGVAPFKTRDVRTLAKFDVVDSSELIGDSDFEMVKAENKILQYIINSEQSEAGLQRFVEHQNYRALSESATTYRFRDHVDSDVSLLLQEEGNKLKLTRLNQSGNTEDITSSLILLEMKNIASFIKIEPMTITGNESAHEIVTNLRTYYYYHPFVGLLHSAVT